MRLPATDHPILQLTAACAVLSIIGMQLHLERFITPERGLGYFLGIIGGSLMVLSMIYPWRKRQQSLAFIGTVKAWFQIHMIFGIVGPVLVLFHSNFQTGASNSNVALVCMLVVAASGLIGRYFYTRIHSEFSDSQEGLAELRAQITRLQQVSNSLAFVPDFSNHIEHVEARMMAKSGGVPGLLRPLVVALRSINARLHMNAHIRRSVKLQGVLHGIPAQRLQRETKAARELARRHIDAVRRVEEFATYERLFRFWHVLHLPLFLMMLVAGIVHVVAVHVY
jgi:hypothetical protein